MPRRPTTLIVIALMLAPWAAHAQAPAQAAKPKRVESSIKILTDLSLVPLTIDVKAFGDWAKPIIDGVGQRFEGEAKGREVVIQVELKAKGEHKVVLAGRPALSEGELKDLRKLIDLDKAPRPKVIDFAFQIIAKINGGDLDASHKLMPELVDPFLARVEAFTRASTAGQVKGLREWAGSEAIPVLAALASKADPKFSGVVKLGATLGKVDVSKKIDIDAIAYKSPDFWRATLEMDPGDPLTPLALIALHCLNGDLDKARRVGEVAAFFDARKSGTSRLLGEFRTLDRAFEAKLQARINAGIAHHDAGRFDRAMADYRAILKDYPGSAWAVYESFHTERAIAMKAGKPLDEIHRDWPRARATILANDPLYALMAEASGQDEVFQLKRRLRINALFKVSANAPADLLEYADIARDLDQYGFAALIDWYGFVRLSTKARGGRDVLEEFLYSLERLGVTSIKDNFRGDHPAEFARIDAMRKRLRDGEDGAVPGRKPKTP